MEGMRARMPFFLLVACAATACGRTGFPGAGGDPSPTPTTPPDGPLVVSVSSAVAEIRPALRDVPVRVTLQNTGGIAVTEVRVALDFRQGDGADRRPDFFAEEAPWADEVGAGASADVDFEVDVSPSAETEDLFVLARVWYRAGAAAHADSSAGLAWSWLPLREILVDNAADENDGEVEDDVTLREAIEYANGQPGADRIRFDGDYDIRIATALPVLQGNSAPILLDGAGKDVTLSPDGLPNGQWMLRAEGAAAIHALRFEAPGSLYPVYDISTNNCNGGEQSGGAVVVQGGTGASVTGSTFDDQGVAERNCFAATIRIDGGFEHHIAGNVFLDVVGDAVSVRTGGLAEFSRNLVIRARDDGIFVGAPSGPTRVVGNVFAGVQLSAVFASGDSADAVLTLLHNTYVKNGRGAVYRGSSRRVHARNEAYFENTGAAIVLQSSDAGGGIDLDFVATSGNALCQGMGTCGSLTVGTNLVTTGSFALPDPDGEAWPDFAPAAGSALVDRGADRRDRAPERGRWLGAGPDIGAVESR